MGDFFKNRIILLLLFLILGIIFLFVFDRLSGQDETPTPAPDSTIYENGTQAQLFCTTDCRGHGQCGDLADGKEMILINSSAPATQNHSRMIANNTVVEIRASMNQQTVGVFDRDRRDTTVFYQVDWGGLTAWVAGWCVASQQ